MDCLVELFSDKELTEFLIQKQAKIKDAIYSLRLKNHTDYFGLASEFINDHTIIPIRLKENELQLLTKADDHSSHFYTIVIRFLLPFEGDAFLFHCKPQELPSNIKTPAGIIKDNTIEFALRIGIGVNPETSKNRLKEMIALFNNYIYRINTEVHAYNKWLQNEIPLLIKQRYEYVQKVQSALDAFGVKNNT